MEPHYNREDVRSNDSESIADPRIYRLSRVEKFRYSRRSKKIKRRSLGDAIQIYASVFHRCEVFMVMSLPLGTRTRAWLFNFSSSACFPLAFCVPSIRKTCRRTRPIPLVSTQRRKNLTVLVEFLRNVSLDQRNEREREREKCGSSTFTKRIVARWHRYRAV